MTDDHSDEDWLALIAGRARPEADAATRAEAIALRAAFLTYRQDAPEGQMSAADKRLDKLLHRGREAGVLTAARSDWRARVLAWWQRPQGLALAFSVVLGAGLVVMWPTTQLPPPASQERSASATQRITAADPAERQRELLAALRGAGLDAQPYERLGRLGIDVALPPSLSDAQRQLLAAQGLAAPAGPVLMVEILAKTSP